MNATLPLTGSHLRTYERIFQHPVSHNLEWRDVHELFRHLGEVEAEPNGNLKVTRNGHVLVLRPAHSKDVSETDEVLALRHFLEQSEAASPEAKGAEAHWLLVIDHRAARLYHVEMRGAVPQTIVPHEPDGYFRHAHHSKEFSRGQEKTDPNGFFEPVAKALQPARQILIFGSGKGTSSEMEQFIGWLKQHHTELAKRIIGSLVVDEHHQTTDELLARAREFYATPSSPTL